MKASGMSFIRNSVEEFAVLLRLGQTRAGRTYVRPGWTRNQKSSFNPNWTARLPPDPMTGLEAATSGVAQAHAKEPAEGSLCAHPFCPPKGLAKLG